MSRDFVCCLQLLTRTVTWLLLCRQAKKHRHAGNCSGERRWLARARGGACWQGPINHQKNTGCGLCPPRSQPAWL